MYSDFMRWLYRGKRPDRIARTINRAWAWLFSTGITPSYMTTLEVTGRKSGRTISQPMAIAIVDRLITTARAVINPQIMGEFFIVATRPDLLTE